jgi:hypothetical protein
MGLPHANHNRDLCLIIKELPDNYNDWVVTTSFYSCIHYVEHKMFPLTVNNVTYQNFNKYYSDVFIKNSIPTNKHEAKIDLVDQNIKSIASKYRWLYEICMNARYKNYIISDMIATIAVQTMEIIEKACTVTSQESS